MKLNDKTVLALLNTEALRTTPSNSFTAQKIFCYRLCGTIRLTECISCEEKCARFRDLTQLLDKHKYKWRDG